MDTKRTVKQPLDCHERALRLLAVRPRTRRELESRLRHAGFEDAEVSSELDRLEEVGLLDDGAFARELADHHLKVRGSGRRAVAGALASKGVSRETIDATLAGIEDDETCGRSRWPRIGLAGSPACGRRWRTSASCRSWLGAATTEAPAGRRPGRPSASTDGTAEIWRRRAEPTTLASHERTP
jgi:Uncharacterized protein conserved in bacteria